MGDASLISDFRETTNFPKTIINIFSTKQQVEQNKSNNSNKE